MSGLRLGMRLPVHCTALGKVLLGCASDKLRESYDRRVAQGAALERFTQATIVDAHKFFENIRVAAVRGFALDLEECSEGLCCVGAPVFDETGELAAALSVSGPAFRLSESRIEGDLVPLVTSIADRLSRSLGYAS
jgi:IclR family acetate operon transcriptional repressor